MFPLLRYFSIASLISVVAVTLLLAVIHHQAERAQLLIIGESNHVALARSFANTLLPHYRRLVASSREIDIKDLPAHPDFQALQNVVREVARGTWVVKVKIYDLAGLTLFSTDRSQVGKDYRENRGFISARDGRPSSELTHRDNFSAFDREIVDRDVLSSYVALHAGDELAIEGVLEVYSDVTVWIEHTDRQAKVITAAVIISLGLLYLVLHMIVQRADRIIREQYRRQQEAEEEIRYLAFFDPLTRLANRRLLQDRLQQATMSSQRSGRWGAVLFIDLDRFKEVNDRHGHDKGDLLLTLVAGRLRTLVREVDTVARWGGDEFVIVLEGIGGERQEAVDHAMTVAGKVLDSFRDPFPLGDVDISHAPSVGVEVFVGSVIGVGDLIDRADAAMYAAKESGGNTIRLFDPAA